MAVHGIVTIPDNTYQVLTKCQALGKPFTETGCYHSHNESVTKTLFLHPLYG